MPNWAERSPQQSILNPSRQRIFDPHNHTEASFDGSIKYRRFLELSAERYITPAITDHDTIEAIKHMVSISQELGIPFLGGVELTATIRGSVLSHPHINVIFERPEDMLDIRKLPTGKSILDIADWAACLREEGKDNVVLLNHPSEETGACSVGFKDISTLAKTGLFHGVEVLGRFKHSGNTKLLHIVQDNNLALIGSTDAHTEAVVGMFGTMILPTLNSGNSPHEEMSFVKAVQNRLTIPITVRREPYTPQHAVFEFVHAMATHAIAIPVF